MARRIAVVLSAFLLGVGILSISVLRSASVKYSFNGAPGKVLGETSVVSIDYEFPFPGRILPDHPLWPLKVVRDRLWLLVTIDPTRKAELLLLLADKRIASSKILFERNKPELAFSTLTKAEKYLEEAGQAEKENREQEIETRNFLTRLAKASLKHRATIREILEIAPEDARPDIIRTEDYSRTVFKEARDTLNSLGITPPENPFNGD